MLFLLLACDPAPADNSDLEAQLAALQAQVDGLQEELDAIEDPSTHDRYTDDEAVAAIQNPDPFTDDAPNLQDLWHNTDNGYWWLHDAEWIADNRSDPPGAFPATELLEMYHETTECEAGAAFADCNATGGIKMYVNGPRITDNDWSAEGWAAAAIRPYHTHTSGMYMVSFGQVATVSDLGQLIPPSGIHMEPHGAHQAIRIDGTGNAGENMRIDLAQGATGISMYLGDEALYCEELGRDCSTTYPLYLRGGRLHLEDLQIERSMDDLRGSGALTAGASTMGVKRLVEYSWDAEIDAWAHCAFNASVTADSLVFVDPYGFHSQSFTPRLLDVWGEGSAPTGCTEVQSITTEASGTYGYAAPDSATAALPGFRVVLVDADGTLGPADFVEDYPVIAYSVVEPI